MTSSREVDLASVVAMRDVGPSPEAAIVRDIAKRAVIAAPVLVGAGAVGWGVDGGLSVAYGLAVVLANFGIAAWLVSTTARISYALLMGATLFGYLFRLAFVAVAVWVVKDMSWVSLVPMCMTLVVAHLGLLFWELRYLSLTLAFPGLKPTSSLPDSGPQSPAQ